MSRIKKRKYSYTVLLAVSFLAAGIWKAETLDKGKEVGSLEIGICASVRDGSAKMQHSEENEKVGAGTFAEETADGEMQNAGGTQESKETVVYQADTSYFDDALFIGDSRTAGLHEYGDLGKAEVFADSGMNVYKIFKKEFKLSTGEKGTLEELLAKRQFGKIYIMLGINELGYPYENTVARYEEMLDRIQALQPDAILFLEANLHITKEKSKRSPIYNNENIDRFNQAAAALADDRTRFYLDVNELFDDEEGSLSEEYTVDEAHVLGIYYADWVEWILEHAVKVSEY